MEETVLGILARSFDDVTGIDISVLNRNFVEIQPNIRGRI